MRIALTQYLLPAFLLMLVMVPGWRRPDGSKVAPPPPPAGLQTDDSYSVEHLVRNIFVKGICDNIHDIQRIGNPGGIGYFENGLEVIGLDRGIILSTGPVANAEGPNDLTDASGDFGDNTGDSDLNLLATDPVRDKVGIEFDFVPLDSFVYFRYVFASEEYCEFVGSVYNDVFGFFISGPGINGGFASGAENVALIPGTDDYVAINDVNHTSNEEFFIRNELPADAEQCGLDAVEWRPTHELIQYDGFTRELTAMLKLFPCETYHIRLVVADVGDAFYDSAVFLEAGSFNIGGAVSVSTAPQTGTEGCNDAVFRFSRSDPDDLSNPLTVQYFISPSGTAEEGADFEPLPGQITIPAGAFSIDQPVVMINDHLPEPDETIILVLDIPCGCYSDSTTMVIRDGPPLFVELPDAAFCGQQPVLLTPQVTGGRPGYTYQWSSGDTLPTLPVAPGATAAYSVTVTDACGSFATAGNLVTVTGPPEAWLSGAAEICEGETAWLPVALGGVPPWRLIYSVGGQLQPPVEGITDSLFQLPASLGGWYEVEEVNDAFCAGPGHGTAFVEVVSLQVQTFVNSTSCAGLADGGITLEVTGGTPPYTFEWAQAVDDPAAPQHLPAGTYSLLVTDAQGCREELTVEVPSPSPLEEVTFDCDDLVSGLLVLSAGGGSPPYQYSVDGENFLDATIFDDFMPGETYALLIADAHDCRLEQDFIMPATYDAMVELDPELELNLGEAYQLQPVLNIPESLVASIRWIPDDNLSCGNCLNPEVTATREQTYTIRVIDIFGCTGEASVRVSLNREVDVYVPNAFSPNGDQLNDRLVVFANALQVRRVVSIQVFNRWGDQVYHDRDFLPNDEHRSWDGAFNGQQLDTGLFVYLLEVELTDGSHATMKGEVVLMR